MTKYTKDEQIVSETLAAFRKRGGVLTLNDTGRVTLGTFVNCSDAQRGRGYLYSVKNYKANKNVSVAQTARFLKKILRRRYHRRSLSTPLLL